MAKIRRAEKGLIVRACATSRSGSCFVLKGAPGEGAACGEALLRSHSSAVYRPGAHSDYAEECKVQRAAAEQSSPPEKS